MINDYETWNLKHHDQPLLVPIFPAPTRDEYKKLVDFNSGFFRQYNDLDHSFTTQIKSFHSEIDILKKIVYKNFNVFRKRKTCSIFY